MAATVTFTKVGTRVTVNNKGQHIGLRGALNVLPHTQDDKIIITQKVNPLTAINGDNDSLVFLVSEISSPIAADRNALIDALQSIFS